MINKLKLDGNWKHLKDRLRNEYHVLNDNDLTCFEGHEDQMIGRLKCKLGKTEAEVRRMLRPE